MTADGDLDEAVAGQAVTLVLAEEIDISRGDVLAGIDQRVAVRSAFSARLLWTSDRPLQSGDPAILRLGAATANASVVLTAQIDIHTFREEPHAAESQASATLTSNGIGRVTVNLDRPLAMSRYSDSRELGSFILIDRQTNDTVALGVIDAVDLDTAKGPKPVADRGASSRPHLGGRARRAVAPVSNNSGDIVREALSWRLRLRRAGQPPAAAVLSGDRVVLGRRQRGPRAAPCPARRAPKDLARRHPPPSEPLSGLQRGRWNYGDHEILVRTRASSRNGLPISVSLLVWSRPPRRAAERHISANRNPLPTRTSMTHHHLKASGATCHWGFFDATLKPN